MVDAMIERKVVTLEEFEEFVDLPENAEKLFELVAGEIIEVPSNAYASKIAMRFVIFIGMYLLQNDIGHVTGEAGGYMVAGEPYAPDVAFTLKVRQEELAKEGYNPIAPDLVVEVDFPSSSQSQQALRRKIINYLAAGTVVWAAYPEQKIIEVIAPGQPVKVLGINDTLDGGSVLPGFTLPVKEIFA